MCMEWGYTLNALEERVNWGLWPSREGGRLTTTVGYRNQWSRRSCSVAKVVGTLGNENILNRPHSHPQG
jgi:hypothetical protein